LLKKKFPTYRSIFFLLVALEGLAIFLLVRSYRQEYEVLVSDKIQQVQVQLQALTSSYEDFSRFLFHRELQVPQVQQALLQAWKNPETLEENREAVVSFLEPLYLQVVQNNIQNIHFFLPDQTRFLCMRNPGREDTEVSEKTLLERTATRMKLTTGFEGGRGRPSFNMYFPFELEEGTTAFAKISIFLEDIAVELTREFRHPYSFVLPESALPNQASPTSSENHYLPSPAFEGFFQVEEEEGISHGLHFVGDFPVQQINLLLQKDFKEHSQDFEDFVVNKRYQGESFVVSFLAIRDPEGEMLGYLVSYAQSDQFFQFLFHNHTAQFSSILLFLFLLFLVHYMHRSRERALQASRAKSAFLANMSHEIRTPMNGILASVELMEEEQMSPRAREHARTIRTSSEGLLDVINDILDFSRVESGKLQLERIPFDLHKTIRDSVNLVLVAASQKEIEVQTLLDPDLPPYLVGDPARLRQVLLNLLGNAVKFTPSGWIRLEVSLAKDCKQNEKTHEKRTCLHFCVEDSGIGIPEEKQKMLFDPFTQADSSVSRKYGGSGLGLSISRRIVQLMGGTLSVRSKEGQGSAFFFDGDFFLPSDEEKAKLLPQNPSPASNLSLQGKNRVLLAEDHPVNQEVNRQLLEKLGFEVLVAGNGQQVLEVLDKNDVDLVLMDVQMPQMDGLQATREIRKMQGPKASIPIIALSASVLEQDRQRAFRSGMDGFISKPVSRAAILEQIQPFLPKMQENARRETIDMETINEYSIDPDFLFQEIGPIFLLSCSELMGKMEEMVQKGDCKGVGAIAHSLKSSSLYVGGVAFSQSLERLEQSCLEEGARSPGELGLLYREVKEHCALLLEDLQKRIKDHQGSP